MLSLTSSIIKFISYKKAVFFILVLGLIAYLNAFYAGFVWDDEEVIVSNKIIQSFSNLSYVLSGANTSTGGAGLQGWFFRPFLTLYFMSVYSISGLNTFFYHFFQITLHLLNSVLVFAIIYKLLKTTGKTKLAIAFVLALIFAVHPGITEAVTYIGPVHYVIFTFFDLITFWFILNLQNKKVSLKKLTLFFLLFLSSLLFIEASIVFFGIATFLLFLEKDKNASKVSLSLGLGAFVYFFLRFFVVQIKIKPNDLSPIGNASLFERLITIPAEIASYLKIFFFPDKLSVSQHFVVHSISSVDFLAPILICITFFGLVLFLSRHLKSKLMLFGLVWFLAGFSVVSNIIPLDMTIAERWLYFPMIGLLIICAGFLEKLSEFKNKTFEIVMLTLFLAIPVLAIRTIIRNSNWYTGLSLFEHDIKVNPDSFDLQTNYGVELFRAGNITEARVHFEKSIALQPKWHIPYNNLGVTYQREKNLDKAKELYKKSLSLSDYYLAYENLAGIYFQTGDYSKCTDFTQNALKKLPNNPHLWQVLSLCLYKQSNLKESLQAAQNAFDLEPTSQSYYVLSKLKQNQPLDIK